ncbi:MAG: hypothetical protein HQL54_05475 [Magnetococcales bacterium]|nr:hypothetical protein [Magnetococcales bacterium]
MSSGRRPERCNTMIFVDDNFINAVVADQSGAYTVDGLDTDQTYDIQVDNDGDFTSIEGSVTGFAVSGEVLQDIAVTD